MIENAHRPYSETSSIIFSRDNCTIVTRGGDDFVKGWQYYNILNEYCLLDFITYVL